MAFFGAIQIRHALFVKIIFNIISKCHINVQNSCYSCFNNSKNKEEFTSISNNTKCSQIYSFYSIVHDMGEKSMRTTVQP